MVQGNPDVEPWHDVAWRLWRRQHLTWVEISRFLAVEGWRVPPGQVADAVLARAAGELRT